MDVLDERKMTLALSLATEVEFLVNIYKVVRTKKRSSQLLAEEVSLFGVSEPTRKRNLLFSLE